MDRETWLEERRKGLGASDIPAVLGVDPWRSAFQVWADKVGMSEETESNEAMEWGHRLEEPILTKYQDETKRTVVMNKSLRIDVCPKSEIVRATVDADVFENGNENWGEVNAKNVGQWKAYEWDDDIPEHYQVQGQAELAATNRKWGSFAVLIGGQTFRWIDFKRHDRFIDEVLIPSAERFWENHVLTENPPNPDDSLSSRKTLQKMFPSVEIPTVSLDADFVDLDEELEDVKRKMKELEAQKRGLENRLLLAIGEAELGLLPNGVSYSYKMQHRDEYVVQAKDYRVLRRRKAK